jgi:RNA polymerase sigma factor (TIGR02999 family)
MDCHEYCAGAPKNPSSEAKFGQICGIEALSPSGRLMHTEFWGETRMNSSRFRGSGAVEDNNGDVTVLLQRWREGEASALEDLIPLVYSQLHAIASGYMQRERYDHTLQPTALVNEVYIRLLKQRKVTWFDRVHFFVFAAKMMRNILKDHARAHVAERRGGVGMLKVPLSEELAWVGTSPDQMLDLNHALDKLEAIDTRKAQLVELRFFLALTMDEAADVLGVSVATAERDLKFARSWLHRELNPAGAPP